MIFNVRYIDTSDWIQGNTGTFWSPIIPLDLSQYIVDKERINEIYSVVGGNVYNIETATDVINKSLYMKFRKLMVHYWGVWGYSSTSPEDYAEEIAIKIKSKLESEGYPWDSLPEKINLVIVRRIWGTKVVWLNNAFYLGEDPEATGILDL